VPVDLLRAVQQRRMFPTRSTQRLQILAQDRIIGMGFRPEHVRAK